MTPLAGHVIDGIEIRVLERRYPREIGYNAQWGPHGSSSQVQACVLFTDQGASGWGFCGAAADELRRFIGRPLAALFKPKIGRGFRYMDRAAGDARDVEVTHLVREHFPDARILVDGNDAYTVEGACRYLEQVADCDLYWIESKPRAAPACTRRPLAIPGRPGTVMDERLRGARETPE